MENEGPLFPISSIVDWIDFLQLFLYCRRSALLRLGPLGHLWMVSRKKLIVCFSWKMNQQSKTFCTNVIFQREKENCLLLYLLRRISNFPICLPACPRWDFGNMEMPGDSIDYIRPSTHLKTIYMTRCVTKVDDLWPCPNDAYRGFLVYPCNLFSLFSILFFVLSFWPQKHGIASSTHLVASSSFTAAIIFLDSIRVFWGEFFNLWKMHGNASSTHLVPGPSFTAPIKLVPLSCCA